MLRHMPLALQRRYASGTLGSIGVAPATRWAPWSVVPW